jgi:hypothetical protein
MFSEGILQITKNHIPWSVNHFSRLKGIIRKILEINMKLMLMLLLLYYLYFKSTIKQEPKIKMF